MKINDKILSCVAAKEDTHISLLKNDLTKGAIVILGSKNHQGVKHIGLGKDLRVKVNANLGVSSADF